MADADIARQHHEHAGPLLAGLEQRLVVLVAPHLAEPAHAVDLVRASASETSGHTLQRKLRRAALSHRFRLPCPACLSPTLRCLRHLGRLWRQRKVRRSLVAPARLRLAPLEVFAQRKFQPVAAGTAFRRQPRSPLSLSSCIAGFCLASWPCRAPEYGASSACDAIAWDRFGEPAAGHHRGGRSGPRERGFSARFEGFSGLPRACATGGLVARTARP